MSEYKECPSCGISFEGKDIYQHFYDDYKTNGIPDYMSREKAIDSITHSYLRIKEKPVPVLYNMIDLEVAALASASMYSWTPDKPTTFGINHCGCEVQGVYDGVLYYVCDACGYRWKRFEWCPDKYITGDDCE
jgi:hypothetical protein